MIFVGRKIASQDCFRSDVGRRQNESDNHDELARCFARFYSSVLPLLCWPVAVHQISFANSGAASTGGASRRYNNRGRIFGQPFAASR